jgi:hypothetical protein
MNHGMVYHLENFIVDLVKLQTIFKESIILRKTLIPQAAEPFSTDYV